MVPPLLRGDETWCQGFSEPGTGSNLGVAAVPGRAHRRRLAGDRARRCGPAWPSTPSAACCSPAPARPSRPTGASPRCSSTWTRPGITVRPIETMHGSPSSPRCSSTTSLVPFERTLGDEGQGWAVAMDLLPYERSTALVAPRRLPAPPAAGSCSTPRPTGAARPRPRSARSPSSSTPSAPAPAPPSTAWPRASTLGAETSIDKVLLATAEQAVFDLVADALPPSVTVGDDPASARWRTEFLYSRAATIYGGSAEIQRNIIARRLLDLGNDR